MLVNKMDCFVPDIFSNSPSAPEASPLTEERQIEAQPSPQSEIPPPLSQTQEVTSSGASSVDVETFQPPIVPIKTDVQTQQTTSQPAVTTSQQFADGLITSSGDHSRVAHDNDINTQSFNSSEQRRVVAMGSAPIAVDSNREIPNAASEVIKSPSQMPTANYGLPTMDSGWNASGISVPTGANADAVDVFIKSISNRLYQKMWMQQFGAVYTKLKATSPSEGS
jgi:hypothetical protein